MIQQQLARRIAILSLTIALSVICPKLMVAGGVIGIIAGVIFVAYLITLLLYVIQMKIEIEQKAAAVNKVIEDFIDEQRTNR